MGLPFIEIIHAVTPDPNLLMQTRKLRMVPH